MRKLLVAPLIAVSLMAGACASASAKSKANESPSLNVPPPPPRVVEPPPEPLPELVTELPATPTPTSPAPRPNRPPSRPAASENKPAEQKPPDPPPAPEPVSTQPPAQPSAQLRTPQTADTSNAAKTIRATIDRANGLLSGVNYGPLNNERKKAYDDAKRFIQQAEEALKQGNLVFALGVANKAETLAKELSGR